MLFHRKLFQIKNLLKKIHISHYETVILNESIFH